MNVEGSVLIRAVGALGSSIKSGSGGPSLFAFLAIAAVSVLVTTTVGVPPLAAAPPTAIDGDLSDWDKSSPIVINSASQVIVEPGLWAGPSDMSAVIYVMWDENNLYVGAEWTDGLEEGPFVSRSGMSLDNMDAMVLYFSTDPSADPERTQYENTDFRVLLAMDNKYWDTGIDRSMVVDKAGIETQGMYYGVEPYDVLTAGYEVAVGELSGGFTLEASIAWANFDKSAHGDVNGDGTVNIIDALQIARYDAGLNPSPFDQSAADADCNGSINIVDALQIARYDAGLITAFECG